MNEKAVPSEIIEIIREVIEHPTQEGGWKLTENPNDPDGGWTYAGVTSKTYNESTVRCNKVQHPIVNHTMMAEWLASAVDVQSLNSHIIKIYYNEFYLPARAVIRNLLDDETLELEGYELSCIVNVGLEHFEQIANDAHSSSEASDKNNTHNGHFCYHWMMYYIRLVQKNAEAWRDYSKFLEVSRLSDDTKRPKTLRAANLAGWFNRVEHWRGTE